MIRESLELSETGEQLMEDLVNDEKPQGFGGGGWAVL